MKRFIDGIFSRRSVATEQAARAERISLRHVHKFVIKRWDTLVLLQRHIAGWLLLVGILIAGAIGYQWYVSPSTMMKAYGDGGVYAEGVKGPLDTLNPLYATTPAEISSSRLLFAGLLGYNEHSKLRGELAESWAPLNDGRGYSVTLRPGLTWHDGVPLTADDIVFTVNLVKDSRTRTRLIDSWRDVTVTKVDDKTVHFNLPNVYAPFPHALTLAILPQHLLQNVEPQALREAAFNRRPVGSGPFAFQRLQTINADQGRLVLYAKRFDNYVLGVPKLEKFQLHSYANSQEMISALRSEQINAANGIEPGEVKKIEAEHAFTVTHAALYHGVYVFLNNDSPVLQDVKVRQALASFIDRGEIRKARGGVQLLEGPLLNEQYPNLPRFQQLKPSEAVAQLDAIGWPKNANGIRAKGDQLLRVVLAAPRDGNYDQALEAITSAWRKEGIEVVTQLVEATDIQQNIIVPRAYDALIYELAIGADPDVYAFWHSSQADPRGLNLSNYRSDIVSDLLVSGQLRTEPLLRERKYRDFVNEWLKDVPAIPLYRPEIGYIMHKDVRALNLQQPIIDPVNRYNGIIDWSVREGAVLQTP